MIAVIFLLGLAVTVLVLLLMELRRLNRRERVVNVFVAGHQVAGRRAHR